MRSSGIAAPDRGFGAAPNYLIGILSAGFAINKLSPRENINLVELYGNENHGIKDFDLKEVCENMQKNERLTSKDSPLRKKSRGGRRGKKRGQARMALSQGKFISQSEKNQGQDPVHSRPRPDRRRVGFIDM
ncbi:hypothetical protein E5288_WYG020115 [Bos mutus]|uniref:Uncharacterized protein n=1 Tax=Bos mutus TaxID=72004 RepID=A0A6B0SF83_9CETA|nr:hypothetical protein [Bos mutus]